MSISDLQPPSGARGGSAVSSDASSNGRVQGGRPRKILLLLVVYRTTSSRGRDLALTQRDETGLGPAAGSCPPERGGCTGEWVGVHSWGSCPPVRMRMAAEVGRGPLQIGV